MKENKNHWYDGLFYDIVIAPNQDKSFNLVKNIIDADSKVIDVGCGTGRFEFSVYDKVKQVDAVDLSERNIFLAKKKLAKKKLSNVQFFHDDVKQYLISSQSKYDFALMSYVIHEIDEKLRSDILKTLAEYSDKIILVDYLVPRPQNYWSWLNEAVEFVAGRDHYSNFKSYVAKGGIKGLAKTTGLKITKEIINTPSTSHIAVLEKL